VLAALLPAAWHRSDQDAKSGVEGDHGRWKAQLGPVRGRNQDRRAGVVIAGPVLVQNVRPGPDELAVQEPATRRLAVAFGELALTICSRAGVAAPHALSRRNATAPTSRAEPRPPCHARRQAQPADPADVVAVAAIRQPVHVSCG
jgi:hypothetical protein